MPADDLLDEIELAEAEFELASRRSDLAAAIVPPDARRSLTGSELQSRANFAELDADISAAGAGLGDRLSRIRNRFVALVEAELRTAESVGAVADFLLEHSATGVASIPGTPALIDEAQTEISGVLEDLYGQGGERVLSEARAQGVALTTKLALEDLDPDAAAEIVQLTKRMGLEALAVALAALRDEAVRAPVSGEAGPLVDSLLRLGQGMSLTSLVDLGRQAAAVADRMGRAGAVERADRQPSRIVASEILDRNACGPCSLTDGQEFDTLDEARTVYPNGLNVNCEGGLRCRGTLVFVWSEETART